MSNAGPQLEGISLADLAESWTSVGFTVLDGQVSIGGLTITLAQSDQEPGWCFESDLAGEIDSIAISRKPDSSVTSNPGPHPNGAIAVDHVVVTTPDLNRTTDALAAAGFPLRRSRPIGDNEQRFFWAGTTIIEMVGPTRVRDDGPARLWGLALVTDDIDASKAQLGDALSNPRDAVQQGRRIAAIRTKEHAISVTIALMTPHRKDPTITVRE